MESTIYIYIYTYIHIVKGLGVVFQRTIGEKAATKHAVSIYTWAGEQRAGSSFLLWPRCGLQTLYLKHLVEVSLCPPKRT